jgi:DNA-binding transcriptional LysR family regulator
MRLTLEALQVIDSIDRNGSFAAAAEELHRVPSAITYSVQQTEQDLDVLLFDRSGHRAKLTEAGQELLREGRHLLRAAADLECRVQQVAKGWESELRIAVDTIVGPEKLYPLIDEFYRQNSGTRLRLATEVLAGSWDALASGRSDLAIGASGDTPLGGFSTRPLGVIEFDFVAAPHHAIIKEALPLAESAIQRHRAVSVGDTSRNLPPRTTGLLSGQDVFTVPNMAAKVTAHIMGLGVGWLPRQLADREVAAGRLVRLATAISKPGGELVIAWRPANAGKALKWFVKRLDDANIRNALLAC